ncbi:MAG: O-antigen ligase family protein, partial [Bacillota bacterium]
AVAVLPVMFVIFAGRATSISASEGTGQDRIKIWSDGFQLFKRSPVFGVGMNRYLEEVYIVAHNSFIHSYAELGFFGGTLFTGAFYYALQSLYQIGREAVAPADSDLLRLRPFILAVVTAYVIGYMSLSRCYSVPTFLVLGLVTAYLRLVSLYSMVEAPRLNFRLVLNCIWVSCGFVIAAYLFVRAFARFG